MLRSVHCEERCSKHKPSGHEERGNSPAGGVVIDLMIEAGVMKALQCPRQPESEAEECTDGKQESRRATRQDKTRPRRCRDSGEEAYPPELCPEIDRRCKEEDDEDGVAPHAPFHHAPLIGHAGEGGTRCSVAGEHTTFRR